jgi:hypothetical protein
LSLEKRCVKLRDQAKHKEIGIQKQHASPTMVMIAFCTLVRSTTILFCYDITH